MISGALELAREIDTLLNTPIEITIGDLKWRNMDLFIFGTIRNTIVIT